MFEKARQAEQKSENAQIKEDAEIGKYTNEIDSYISGNRDVELTEEVKKYINSQINTNFNTKFKFGQKSLLGSNNNTVNVTFDEQYVDDNYCVSLNINYEGHYNCITYSISNKSKDGFTIHLTTSNFGSASIEFLFNWITIHN